VGAISQTLRYGYGSTKQDRLSTNRLESASALHLPISIRNPHSAGLNLEGACRLPGKAYNTGSVSPMSASRIP
jgi:hypothetical protein